MEKQEIVKLLKTKYSSYLENDDMEGLLFEVPVNIRPEVASFLMFDVGMDILNDIEEIPDRMLYGSVQVDRVILPKKIKSIGEGAFANSSITSFTIENGSGITKIPDKCFSGCDDLQKVKLPISVVEIGTDAFANCSNLTSLITPHRTKRNQKIKVSQSDREMLQNILSDKDEETN